MTDRETSDGSSRDSRSRTTLRRLTRSWRSITEAGRRCLGVGSGVAASAWTEVRELVADVGAAVEDLDEETVALGSVFVFVLVTVLVSISAIIDYDSLAFFVTEGEIWEGASAVNDDDGGGQLFGNIGPFAARQGRGLVITDLGRIAFIVVIGQVIHRVNMQAFEHVKAVSLLGIGLFSLSLLFSLESAHRTVWILMMQVFVLVYFTGAIVLIALVRGGNAVRGRG